MACFHSERSLHEVALEPPTVRDGTARWLACRHHDRQGREPPGVRLGDDEVPHFLSEPVSVNVSRTSRVPWSTTTRRSPGPSSPAAWHECHARLCSAKAPLESTRRRNPPKTTGRDFARAQKNALRRRRPNYYYHDFRFSKTPAVRFKMSVC